MDELEEMSLMLRERVEEWTREWRQAGFDEGFLKGRAEGLAEGRQEGREAGFIGGIDGAVKRGRIALAQILEERFGTLPQEARLRLESLTSIEDIVKLTALVAASSSLDVLAQDRQLSR